jgi:hypothetical protein
MVFKEIAFDRVDASEASYDLSSCLQRKVASLYFDERGAFGLGASACLSSVLMQSFLMISSLGTSGGRCGVKGRKIDVAEE